MFNTFLLVELVHRIAEEVRRLVSDQLDWWLAFSLSPQQEVGPLFTAACRLDHSRKKLASEDTHF